MSVQRSLRVFIFIIVISIFKIKTFFKSGGQKFESFISRKKLRSTGRFLWGNYINMVGKENENSEFRR